MNKVDKKKLKIEKALIEKEREQHHNEVIKEAMALAKQEKTAPEEFFISLQNVNKIYPNHVQAVYDFNLDIKPTEFIVFVGPSGCGKSTTLRMIAGLEDITYGDLYMDKVYANDLSPKDRNIGMVFQNYALYPHMTVYENMAFSLKIKGVGKEEIERRIEEASKLLQLEDYLDRKPNALSGGQCQRVALGRAIVTDSSLFLMDEPLSNLDAKLRVTMRSEIVKIHRALKKTTIYVTHDQTEAMTMADRIVVMNKGYIQQIGTPEEIFNTPSNLFVATFVGSPSMNLFNSKLNNDSLVLENGFKVNVTKDLAKKVNEFYVNEIELTNNEINSWKNKLLSREKLNKNYQKIFAQSTNEQLLNKYINNLNEELLSKLDINKEQLILKGIENKDAFDDLLKEYLFLEKESLPEINALNEKLEKLTLASKNENTDLILGIRPEHFVLKDKAITDALNLKVNVAELLGSEYFIHTDFMNKDLIVKIPALGKVKDGDEILISFNKQFIHVFDPITSKRINL